MKEYVNKKKEILVSKIEKLIEQFNFLLVEEFPFGDTHTAIKALKHQASKLRSRLEDYDSYSSGIKISIARHINYTLEYSSHILGILARSATTRNAFELYQPFKDELKPFFDDQIYLIISSEWSYVPFTYPMNLQELPDFIIIGLPATESNNVLIFPSAAHELGHSIWLKKNISDSLSNEVSSYIKKFIDENQKIIEVILPNIPGGKENNLFSQEIKRQFVVDSTESCLRQLEEIFCDFMGLGLYGKSYLHAFAYLIAPSDGGPRSLHYPDTKARAKLLADYAAKYGLEVKDYDNEFSSDQQRPAHTYEQIVLRVADQVRNQFESRIFDESKIFISKSGNKFPDSRNVSLIKSFFENGLPTDGEFSIGEILCAAWEFFLSTANSSNDGESRPKIAYISDLVLKSVEAQQFSEKMANAKRR